MPLDLMWLNLISFLAGSLSTYPFNDMKLDERENGFTLRILLSLTWPKLYY